MPPSLTHAQRFTRRSNGIVLLIVAGHLPLAAITAAIFGHSTLAAGAMALAICAGPALMFFLNRASRLTSAALAIACTSFSALLIHLSGGMIEMHFHIFVVLSLTVMFADVLPVLASAATTAVHHALFWLFLPASIFNYKAGIGIVALHALFVVAETIPACWIALQLRRSVHAQSLTVDQLPSVVSELTRSTKQFAAISQTLAGGVAEQERVLAQTSTSSEHIQASTDATRTYSAEMVTAVGHVTEGFMGASRELDVLVGDVDRIQDTSHKIAKIVGLIDEIAMQTNLLSLNASVEAARAGESGGGFAVIAEEVRNLARRCTEAAGQTADLVQECTRSSSAGAQRSTQVSAMVSQMGRHIITMAGLTEQVDRASREQAEKLQQVFTSVHDLRAVTDRNSQAATAGGKASVLLEKQASTISQISAALKTLSTD